MPNHKYLIIGGGMSADAAVAGIREGDPDGSIGLIGDEDFSPYKRPLLSKGLWKGTPLRNVWLTSGVREATLHLGHKVRALDPVRKCVSDDGGTIYGYEKLLLATGGTPRRLPGCSASILYFRTLADYHRLRLLADERRRFAVIGGGFIGSEIAAALAMNGKEVVMIFPDRGIGGRGFPAALAEFLNEFFREKGVEVRPEEEGVAIEEVHNTFVIKTRAVGDRRQEEITVDAVVAGLGIEPNVELAHRANLEIGNGIRVDFALRTSHPDIYAAGDVAEFFNPALGEHLRVEHEDNALVMGEMAGRSMAGLPVHYDHLPSFYSDLFELGYEAVGETDSRLETVADWKEPNREGVVYYLREGRVRGVLLWNVWEQVDAARHLIAEAGQFRAADLKGRLPAVHQHV
jgi:3-phenylpropionate/trans-cinnamate dioxygenase ferredoxin reductase component